eukprot:170325-Lingulodinium_polyedra.AAC.1
MTCRTQEALDTAAVGVQEALVAPGGAGGPIGAGRRRPAGRRGVCRGGRRSCSGAAGTERG